MAANYHSDTPHTLESTLYFLTRTVNIDIYVVHYFVKQTILQSSYAGIVIFQNTQLKYHEGLELRPLCGETRGRRLSGPMLLSKLNLSHTHIYCQESSAFTSIKETESTYAVVETR
ncbi:hypothetical protein YC2023_078998 [Brassica napus]